jgi:hypothetical protein
VRGVFELLCFGATEPARKTNARWPRRLRFTFFPRSKVALGSTPAAQRSCPAALAGESSALGAFRAGGLAASSAARRGVVGAQREVGSRAQAIELHRFALSRLSARVRMHGMLWLSSACCALTAQASVRTHRHGHRQPNPSIERTYNGGWPCAAPEASSAPLYAAHVER